MSNYSLDSLVLRVDEFDNTNRIDTTLFVFYDHSVREYVIRGSRRGEFAPYSFVCRTQKDTSLFIETAIGIHSKVSYTLINYKDLPFNSLDIDYDYLFVNFDPRYNEVIGYDKLKLKYNDSNLNRYLRILRVVFNHYDEV